jgi:hypothetical protein
VNCEHFTAEQIPKFGSLTRPRLIAASKPARDSMDPAPSLGYARQWPPAYVLGEPRTTVVVMSQGKARAELNGAIDGLLYTLPVPLCSGQDIDKTEEYRPDQGTMAL